MGRRWPKWLLVALTVVLVLPALPVLFPRSSPGDSLAALPRGGEPAIVIPRQTLHEGGRVIQQVTIEDPVLGHIGLVVSLPDPLPDHPLPVVVVLGGLGTGLKNIRHMPPAGDNAVVGYDWPIPRKIPRGFDLLRQVPELYDRVLAVPGQIAVAVEWAVARPWAERGRISLLGFSLGAVAAPAAQRILGSRGLAVGWTVLAYGGADIGNLLAHHPRAGPEWTRPLLGWLAGRLFHPVDPAGHLPYLSGRFLVIGGTDDALIPERSARLMRDLTPEPKTVLLLRGRHMGVGQGQEALLQAILQATEDWLTDQGAVNPG